MTWVTTNETPFNLNFYRVDETKRVFLDHAILFYYTKTKKT
jgi:hypothetical protein